MPALSKPQQSAFAFGISSMAVTLLFPTIMFSIIFILDVYVEDMNYKEQYDLIHEVYVQIYFVQFIQRLIISALPVFVFYIVYAIRPAMSQIGKIGILVFCILEFLFSDTVAHLISDLLTSFQPFEVHFGNFDFWNLSLYALILVQTFPILSKYIKYIAIGYVVLALCPVILRLVALFSRLNLVKLLLDIVPQFAHIAMIFSVAIFAWLRSDDYKDLHSGNQT